MSQQFNLAVPRVNNNPFLPDGRIHRLSFFLTMLVLCFISSWFVDFSSVYNASAGTVNVKAIGWFPVIVLVLQLFACMKRCRDIQYSPWSVVLFIIPIVGFIYGLLLLFKGSKYPD